MRSVSRRSRSYGARRDAQNRNETSIPARLAVTSPPISVAWCPNRRCCQVIRQEGTDRHHPHPDCIYIRSYRDFVRIGQGDNWRNRCGYNQESGELEWEPNLHRRFGRYCERSFGEEYRMHSPDAVEVSGVYERAVLGAEEVLCEPTNTLVRY